LLEAGVVTTRLVDVTLTVIAELDPNCAVVPVPKPRPLIVTWVPPSVEPPEGESELTAILEPPPQEAARHNMAINAKSSAFFKIPPLMDN
jgi:hypothetical protein